MVVLGLIGWRIWVARTSQQTSPQNQTEVVKTSQSGSVEDRLKELEFAVTDLIKQVRDAKTSNSASTGNADLDAKLNNLEASVNDLRARVIKLETGTSGVVQTTTTTLPSTTKPPSYIPLGWSGSSRGTDWTDLSGQEFTIDSGDYSGYKTMQFEINIRIFQNGMAYARLFDKDDGIAILQSEVSTGSTDYTWLSSNGFTLPSGKKTYKLQVKSLTGYSVDVTNARIKVNF